MAPKRPHPPPPASQIGPNGTNSVNYEDHNDGGEGDAVVLVVGRSRTGKIVPIFIKGVSNCVETSPILTVIVTSGLRQ